MAGQHSEQGTHHKQRTERKHYKLTCLVRPGKLPEARRTRLVDEVLHVADRCFDGDAPDYQVLTGRKEELDRAVISLARRADGSLAGFCSCLLLDVPGVGEVFHLGLSCVDPDDRSQGLSHRLMSKAVAHYLIFHRPLSTVWFSNVACVLSSLGNVALHFENVHPSPSRSGPPSAKHLAVARAISAAYREPIAIDAGASLDEEAFVFRGSVPGTCFEKSEGDARYHHRDRDLTGWYADRLHFEQGDEVCQVGTFSILGFVRYALRGVVGKLPRFAAPRSSARPTIAAVEG
jgi:GNAT superfamily N-acetyltransferase